MKGAKKELEFNKITSQKRKTFVYMQYTNASSSHERQKQNEKCAHSHSRTYEVAAAQCHAQRRHKPETI